jgi:hypothetical protein
LLHLRNPRPRRSRPVGLVNKLTKARSCCMHGTLINPGLAVMDLRQVTLKPQG